MEWACASGLTTSWRRISATLPSLSANDPLKEDRMKGMVGTGCGPDSVGYHFGKPLCLFNMVPIIHTTYYAPCLAFPPIFTNKSDGELLTLGQSLELNASSYSQIQAANVEIKVPTPEQISKSVNFFLDRYVHRRQLDVNTSRSWKVFNANFIKSMMIFENYYLEHSLYTESFYSSKSHLSQNHRWINYVHPEFALSPEFFQIVGDEWLDIR